MESMIASCEQRLVTKTRFPHEDTTRFPHEDTRRFPHEDTTSGTLEAHSIMVNAVLAASRPAKAWAAGVRRPYPRNCWN